jgi:hypothetical protein
MQQIRFLSWICLLATMATEAPAGAWTRPEGETFASVSTSYYRTDPDSGYEEATLNLYFEHGLRDWLTVGGALEATQPVGAASSLDGETTLAGFAQAQLWTGSAGDPLSLQIGLRAPLGDVASGKPPQLEDDWAAEARLLYGRGFDTGFGPGFADAQAALRLNRGDDADELRLDLTAGLRPAPRWLIMVQSLNTIGLRNATGFGADFDVYKIAPAVGYEIGWGATLLLSVEREIAGRGITQGTRARLGVWTTF